MMAMMVILCIDLAGPWCQDVYSNIILDVSLKGFWIRLTFKSVDFE